MNFEGVVLSGGGTKGILTLGALHYYYEKGTYNHAHVQTYSATSVGTSISVLLLCGYTPIEIFIEVYKTHNLFQIPNNISIFDISKNMGVLPIESFSCKIKNMIESKLGFIPTLEELKGLTNKTLIATVSNVTKMRTEYYSHENNPTISSLLATELSCCLPVVFRRMKYGEDYMTDGGLTDNFPIKQIDDGKKKILAIATIIPESSDSHPPEDQFIGYFYRLMLLPVTTNNNLRLTSCGSNVTLIKIKYDVDIFEVSISEDKKMDMFTIGYQTAEYKDKAEYMFVEGIDNM
jgi:predicted acylesterase/phospholipase RssA